MKGNKIQINDKRIETLLNGRDPQEGIRYIDANNYSINVKVFYRKKQEKTVKCSEHTLSPFLWFKGFDFNEHFCWKSIAIPTKDVDFERNVLLYKGEICEMDGEKIKYVGKSPDETKIFVSFFLDDIEDRKKLCKQKIDEYNIIFKECITRFDDTQIDRLEKGYKFLVHILPTSDEFRYSSNPLFQYKKNGKKKKIIGSYNNLIDFFAEGGINVYESSGVFLDRTKIFNFLKKATKKQQVLSFLLLFQFTNTLFSSKTIEKNRIVCAKLLKDKYDETTSKQKSLEVLFKKYFKTDNGYNCFISDLNFLSKNLKLNFDEELIEETIDSEYNFGTKKTYLIIKKFFDTEKIDVFFGKESLIFRLPVLEQFMIQTGKRLFKGYDEYSDLNSLIFDIETEAQPEHINYYNAALFPEKGRIFKNGVLSKSHKKIYDAKTDEEEIKLIEDFFDIIFEVNPDILLTYNGEGFDFPFILKRYEILKRFKDEEETISHIQSIFKEKYDNHYLLDFYKNNIFYRRIANLKTGGTNNTYTQTHLLGVNVCDTMFAVKRAAAIDKSIPNFKLKDNIKHAKKNKNNRVYVDGDKIGFISNDKRPYLLNKKTGKYFCMDKSIQFVDSFDENDIHNDLSKRKWYGEKNNLYVYSSFDPNFLNGCENTILYNGGDLDYFIDDIKDKTGQFKTVVFNKKHIGYYEPNKELITSKLKDFRLWIESVEAYKERGYNEDYELVNGNDIIQQYLYDDLEETITLDEHYSQATFEISKWLPTSYQRAATMGGAAVWKLLLATWFYEEKLAIPDYDEQREFSGGLVGLTSSGWHGESAKLDFSSLYPAEFIEHVKSPIIDISEIYKMFMRYGLKTRLKYKRLMNEANGNGDFLLALKYDKKQLPLKILINSFYGMMGAALVSPFADIVVAQWITCNGRQQLRHLIKWFEDKKMSTSILHTDGVYFRFTEQFNKDYRYTGKGKNWLVSKDKEYIGLAAYVAEYNDLYMKGVMGLDIDEITLSDICLSKGNYIYFKKKKKTEEYVVEYVGGSLIKKNQSQYIVNFLEDNTSVLLKGDGKEFIKRYWDFIDKIKNMEIKAMDIASKGRVKKTVEEYIAHTKGRNKNGGLLPKQTHMDLCIEQGLNPELGDWVYYVNIGKSEQDSDSGTNKIKIGFFHFENNLEIEELKTIFQKYDKQNIVEFLLKQKQNGNFLTKEDDSYIDEIIMQCDVVDGKIRENKKGVFFDVFANTRFVSCKIVEEADYESYIDYNADFYIKKFMSATSPLFLCFDKSIRTKLQEKDKTKRPMLTDDYYKLVCNQPNKKDDEDKMSDILTLTEEENQFWKQIDFGPDSFLEEK